MPNKRKAATPADIDRTAYVAARRDAIAARAAGRPVPGLKRHRRSGGKKPGPPPSSTDLDWYEHKMKSAAMHRRTAFHVRVAERLLRAGQGNRQDWGYLIAPMEKFLADTKRGRPDLFVEAPKGARANEQRAGIISDRRPTGFRIGRVSVPAPPVAPKDPSFIPEFKRHLALGRYKDASAELKRALKFEKDPAMQKWLRERVEPALERARTGPQPRVDAEGKARCRLCGQESAASGINPSTGGCWVCTPQRSPSIRTLPGGSPGLGKRR